MQEFFSHIVHWHWWLLAIVLIVLELLAPGTFFLWLGISAAVAGALLFIAPATPWQAQLLVFAILSIASIVAWRRYAASRTPAGGERSTLNRRSQQYVGRTFTLTEPVVNGFGKIRVDDSTWKIEGEDCPAGTTIRVVGVDGTILRFERGDQ